MVGEKWEVTITVSVEFNRSWVLGDKWGVAMKVAVELNRPVTHHSILLPPPICHRCTLDFGHHWPIQFHSHCYCHLSLRTTHWYILPPPSQFATNVPLTLATTSPSNSTATIVTTCHFSPITTHHSGKFSNHLPQFAINVHVPFTLTTGA